MLKRGKEAGVLLDTLVGILELSMKYKFPGLKWDKRELWL